MKRDPDTRPQMLRNDSELYILKRLNWQRMKKHLFNVEEWNAAAVSLPETHD